MTRRYTSGLRTTSKVVQLATARDIPVPEGVTLRSEEERIIWQQFTQARASGDWREFDLILLAKVVRLEADIRKYQAVLAGVEPVLENRRGKDHAHPLFNVIDTLQRQQLAIIRSMSLTATGRDSRTMAGNAAAGRKLREAKADLDDGLIPGLND